jgi:AcrR family transcriptional regulator
MEAVRERSDVRRQAIVDAAVALADSDGVAAVTMRNVAERLGVGTMTLYSYVTDKHELLDLMGDEVSRSMLLPEPLPRDWRVALRQIALRTHHVLDRHPWIFDARSPRPRHRINTMRHVEQSLEAVAPLGLDPDTTVAVLMAVDDYTLGHAVRKHARRRMFGDRPTRADLDPAVGRAIEAGELPLLEARLESGAGLGAHPGAEFEQGLDWLLDGIEASVTAGR